MSPDRPTMSGLCSTAFVANSAECLPIEHKQVRMNCGLWKQSVEGFFRLIIEPFVFLAGKGDFCHLNTSLYKCINFYCHVDGITPGFILI
jgi:hypothetical protein